MRQRMNLSNDEVIIRNVLWCRTSTMEEIYFQLPKNDQIIIKENIYFKFVHMKEIFK